MQYAWLEKMVKEGQISSEASERIYNDCSQLLEKDAVIRPEVVKALDALGTSAVLGAGWLGYEKLKNWHLGSQTIASINNVKASLLKDSAVELHKEKAAARFDELARMFPTVATQKELSHKLVKARLHTGFTPEDLSSLAATNTAKDVPGLQSRVSKVLTKKAEVRPEVIAHILADSLAIIKEASGVDILKTNTSILKALAAVTGANLLVGVGVGAVNKIRSSMEASHIKKELEKSYQDALKQSDPYNEPLFGNKDKARQAFETLAHFSPSTAMNPSVARGFMNHMVSQNLGTSIGTVKELSEIERNLKGARGSGPFMEGFRSGTEATNFGGVFQKAVGDGFYRQNPPPKI